MTQDKETEVNNGIMKKFISFLVILLAFSILGAALVFGTSNFGLGFGVQDGSERIRYAYALDRAGGIYYITDTDGVKSLSAVDSSGKRLFEKKLHEEAFGEHFYIGGIYVEHDMNIYVTAYEYDENTHFITEASVHLFYEDGTHVEELFRQPLWVSPEGSAKPVSAFSEDDDYVYFSLTAGGLCEAFRMTKDHSEPAEKVAEYDLTALGSVYGQLTLPGGSMLAGSADGITVFSEDGARTVAGTGNGTVFDRFWSGIGLYYAMDSATGTVYVISDDFTVSSVMDGARTVDAGRGLTLSDMSEVAVGITGNILGIRRGASDTVYYGSFSLMSELFADSADKGEMINIVLALAAVAVAVLLLTVLTWDFYVGILKMRLSILFRQSLLIAMLMFVGLYALSYLFIIPQVENIVTANYRHEAQLIASSFEGAIRGVMDAEENVSSRAYHEFLARYGNAVRDADPEDSFTGDDESARVTLIEVEDGEAHMIASGDLYPQGYLASGLLYGHDIDAVLSDAAQGETFFISRDVDGQWLYLFRPVTLRSTANPVYLVVGTRITGLSQAADELGRMINMFFVVGGLIIIAIFMIIENITAGAVRKLKRAVNSIAGGKYATRADIHTGDEVEELAIAVNALSAHIIDKTTSLEQLNRSYYRFVPLAFLDHLGETQIERVGKSLHAKREMTTMYLRFSFSRSLTGLEPQEIFHTINAVFELITPIVADHGGTAFNFTSDGFNAIFNETEQALQAAIKIHEDLASHNAVQRARRTRTTDLRIVLGRDEVLLGFVGDDQRMEPTVVSPAINESQEIETLCADSAMYIVATERAFRDLPQGKYRSRCIGNYATETSGAIRLYDMFDGDPYAMIKLKEQFMTRFDAGIKLFTRGDYAGARTMFMDIVKYAHEDGVARNYMYLAEHNIGAEEKLETYRIYRQ